MAVVGIARWVLHLPGCHSLKAKRSIVRSLKERLRTRFKVSVAETAFQDVWQKAEITAAFVTTDRSHADSLMDKLERQVISDPRAEIVERQVDLL